MLRVLRSWTLQRYVLSEFAISFILAVTACTMLMLLGVFFMKAADYEEFGVTTGQVAMLFPYLLPRALSWAIPPAAMIAVTTVFGRLSAENEIIAAQAGGAPLRVLAFPILLAGVVLSGFCLWCNQGLLNWGNSTIRNEILKLDKPEFFTNLEKPGNSVPLKTEGGGVIHINWLPHEVDAQTKKVRRPIHIAYFQNQEVGQTVFARDYLADSSNVDASGSRILVLTLKDAQVFGEKQAQAGTSASRPNLSDMQSFCKEFTLQITLPRPSKLLDMGKTRGEVGWLDNYAQAAMIKESNKARHHFMLQRAADFGAHAVAGSPADPAAPLLTANSWSEARIASEGAYGTGGARDRAKAEEAECYRKLGLSFLPISTVILGIGLGLLVRKSARLIGFLLGLLVYALLYYPMMIVSKEMVRASLLPLWALFIPNLVLFLIGYGLWRAYERGWLENLSSWLSNRIESLMGLRDALWARPSERLGSMVRTLGFVLFRGKTDAYITGSFVAPLVVVLLSVSAIRVTLDLFQHGEEVIDGVMRAAEPLGGIKRTQTQAIADVFSYYGIRALEMVCDILPLLILFSGVICVTALVRNNEHLIFKSSGIRLQRAFRPIIATTLLLSLAVTAMRETCMPSLIMLRDYLKPLVYHRNAAPTAIALHTVDAEGRGVLFQMSQYSSTRQEGTSLRIYQVGNGERIPVFEADRALWNGTGWDLLTDTHKLPLMATGKHTELPPKDPSARFAPHGYLVTFSQDGHTADAPQADGEIRQIRTHKTPVKKWQGAVSPAFLESERLGSGVMGLKELQAAALIKPEFNVEWWRRVSEWTLAVFLLWLTIPLLVSEIRGHFVGVAMAILFGALSWALTVACTEAGRMGHLPQWAPLLPPALFLVLGSFQYYRKMPT